MQVQTINNAACFQGKFEVNPIFNKFKEELNPTQRTTFENLVKRVEKEQDGRVFKFDRILNSECTKGAEVGIFERKYLIDKTIWIPLFYSTRERAARCFEQFNNMYNDILTAKFIERA